MIGCLKSRCKGTTYFPHLQVFMIKLPNLASFYYRIWRIISFLSIMYSNHPALGRQRKIKLGLERSKGPMPLTYRL